MKQVFVVIMTIMSVSLTLGCATIVTEKADLG